MNAMIYKGYLGSVEYDELDNVLYGKIQYINDSISYEGKTFDEIKNAFETEVDRYLKFCKKVKKSPDKPSRSSEYPNVLKSRNTADKHPTQSDCRLLVLKNYPKSRTVKAASDEAGTDEELSSGP